MPAPTSGLGLLRSKRGVLDHFQKASGEIKQLLNDHKDELEKCLCTVAAVSLEVFMVAKIKSRFFLSFFTGTPDDILLRRQTKPALAIVSSNKTYCKRALEILKRHNVLNHLPGFTLLAFHRDPAASMAKSEFSSKAASKAQQSPRNSTLVAAECIQLLFSNNNLATLGGIVTIQGSLYGMTACHAEGRHTIATADGDDTCSDFSDDFEIGVTSAFSFGHTYCKHFCKWLRGTFTGVEQHIPTGNYGE